MVLGVTDPDGAATTSVSGAWSASARTPCKVDADPPIRRGRFGSAALEAAGVGPGGGQEVGWQVRPGGRVGLGLGVGARGVIDGGVGLPGGLGKPRGGRCREAPAAGSGAKGPGQSWRWLSGLLARSTKLWRWRRRRPQRCSASLG